MQRKAWAVAALAVLLLGALLTVTGAVRAQVSNTLTTTTAVPPSGTLATTVTTVGVTITSSTAVSGCPISGTGTASVTYTCSAGSSGVPVGTVILQTFSVPAGPITETVTYNANGPLPGFAAVQDFTQDSGTCTLLTPMILPGMPALSSCTGDTSAVVVPGSLLAITVSSTASQSKMLLSAPSSLGSCPLTTTLPEAADSDHVGEIVYACGGEQSIPAGTKIVMAVQTLGAGGVPKLSLFENYDGTVPATLAIPIPTTQTASVAGPAPTLASIAPSTGSAGTIVTLTGANLTGATAVSFGTTTAITFSCATATSCIALAPSLSSGTTANVTVAGPGGSSNPLTFAFSTPASAIASTGSTQPDAAATSGSTSATQAATAAGNAGAAPLATAVGLNVSYPAGWSIVAGPSGSSITGSSGPLYAFPPGSSVYEVTPVGAPLVAGQGYWAFFAGAASVTLPLSGPQSQSIVLPASQWAMLGNPGSSPANVTGADIVYVYSDATGYQATTTLGPGQGAWVFSTNGGSVTISSR